MSVLELDFITTAAPPVRQVRFALAEKPVALLSHYVDILRGEHSRRSSSR